MPADFDHAATVIAAAVLGPVFGSFVTALTYRLPRAESIAEGRSRCPACGTALTVRDLIPIASWLGHRGRCGHCGAPISARYPVIESLCLVFFVASAVFLRDPWRVVLTEYFVVAGLALAVIDFEHQRLPDQLILFLVPFALVWRWYSGQSLADGAIAAAITYAGLLAMDWVFIWRTGASGIGGGDVKLIALAALCLPLLPFFAFVFVASAMGVPLAIWWRKHTGRVLFPFGVTIVLAWWLCLIVRFPPIFVS